MNFGSVPKIPAVPTAPAAPSIPTRQGQDVGSGPAQGNVGIGAPQHFDPNNPSVRLDGTVHNPTGVGGDLKVSREVSANDLKNIPVPNPSMPDLPSMPSLGGGSSAGSSGGGFSLPSIGNPLSGLSMPSMPDLSLPSMPDVSLPSMPSMPSMPSLGNPFSGLSAPDLPSLPDMPSFGNPFSGLSGPDVSLPDLPSMGTPGMPGFRFLELPELPDLELDLSEWDLLPSFDFPDWEGDSESERQKPDVRAKKSDKVKVEVRLETEEGVGIAGQSFRIQGTKGFRFVGALDKEGNATVEVPRGDYDIQYLGSHETPSRALASRIRKALNDKSPDAIALLFQSFDRVLLDARQKFRATFSGEHSKDMFDLCIEACSKHPSQSAIKSRIQKLTSPATGARA